MNYCVTLYEQRGKTWHIKDVQFLWADTRAALVVAIEALHKGPYTIEEAHGNF